MGGFGVLGRFETLDSANGAMDDNMASEDQGCVLKVM